MKILFTLICSILALFGGFHLGKPKAPQNPLQEAASYPTQERKTFAFIVYAYNQAEWVEKTLKSILEQEYDYYRIVFIDDGSQDKTFQVARALLEGKPQEEKTIWIRNEKKLGYLSCLYQGVQNLLDREIAVPLLSPDWLAHDGVLSRMNQAFQNPNTWIFRAEGILYPSYEASAIGCDGFYAAVLKQIPLEEILKRGDLREGSYTYLKTLETLTEDKISHTEEILLIKNRSAL